jgi:hypothetical protein
MATDKQQPQNTGKPIIIFHGDKGGVGKSLACSAFADFLMKSKIPVALVDGDTRNPDISRMFGDMAPVSHANLRDHEGWMDLIDFVAAEGREREVVCISMPAGVGNELRKEASRFVQSIQSLKRSLSMFWVINRQIDSINLLNEALTVIGEHLQSKFVVKNLFFGNESMFGRWDTSETRKRFEKSGGMTIKLLDLHERTIDKLYASSDNVMPFSVAVAPIDQANKSPHNLTPSENMELVYWLQENHKTFEILRPMLGI